MKHHLLRCSLWLFTWTLMPFLLLGQKNPQAARELLQSDLKVKSYTFNDQLGTPSFILFTENSQYRFSDALQVLKKYFELESAGNELKLIRTDILQSGVRIDRYKLFFNGIKVEHSSYVVISRTDQIISVNAESYSLDIGFSIAPSLQEEGARTKALSFVNARKYAWDALEEDKVKVADNPALQQKFEELKQQYFPKGDLVIAKDVYGSGQARLAWKFDIYATEPLGRYYIYVDASNGKIILRDAIIKHAGTESKKSIAPSFQKSGKPDIKNRFDQYRLADQFDQPPVSELGSGQTRYAGTRNIYATRVSVPVGGTSDPHNPLIPLSYSGVDPRLPVTGPVDVFILKDDTRGGGIETYDMNAVGGLPLNLPALHTQSLAFLDKDNNWKNEIVAGTNEDLIRGATSNGTIGTDEGFNDDYALDAHWGAEMVYDYWKTKHGRLSFDNRNSAIKSYVHYGPAYDNAFWNGSVMTYGDGSGTVADGFRPLTSLDVCGHEIGHGVCSYTSDLVYELESGAMNEALSDIWAACVERFVKTTIDPSLSFQYYQVGEQIAPDNIGLRRMDNPKEKSDPDTYGGQNWVNQTGCTPSLANDQCGVHTNSGVLNKWFYLIVEGPLATTGSPVYTDDGRADLGAVANGGNIYAGIGSSIPAGEFVGLGFDQAEAITYLMELTLTPNATYAEARTVSINAARILYGECSQAEKTITDAWFAVNVGDRYLGCTAAYLLNAITGVTNIEEGTSGDCISYNEYTISTNLITAQGSAFTVNFAATGGTAAPHDFALSATSITYNAGETGLKSIKLRIYADAMVEGSETIQITATCASPALNQVFDFTVEDDDVDLIIGATVTLLNENFEAVSEGPYSAPSGDNSWGKIDKISPSPVQWSVRANGIVPLLWTGKRAIIELPALPGQAAYDQLAEAKTILRTPLINATGLNSIRVQFIYKAGGEPACDPACDYAQVVYSFDGVNFSTFTAESEPLYLMIAEDGNFDYILPASFNGKQFYLGILWYDDTNAGTSGSVAIDNFVVTAQGKAIENDLDATVGERVTNETGKSIYFFSTDDGELITRISNSTVHNYGCVSATIEKAGNSTFTWYSDGTNLYKAADKIVKSIPTSNNLSGTYTVYLYFTETQIAALESISGSPRASFKLHHTTASSYIGATGSNTVIATLTNYTGIAGVGGVFSATFDNGLLGSFALAAPLPQAPLPVKCADFKASKKNDKVMLQWKVEDEYNNNKFEIERSTDGRNFSMIGTVHAASAGNGLYAFTDDNITGLKNAYYRLKQFDLDGKYTYICTILSMRFDSRNELIVGKIYPNPGNKDAFVNVNSPLPHKLRIEYINTLGQTINVQNEQLQPGAARLQLPVQSLASGTYMIHFKDEEGQILSTQSFIRY